MVDGLFRGKRKDNGEWVYGYYGQFHNRPKVQAPNSHQIFEPSEHAFIGGSCIGGFWRVVIPETVGRVTEINGIQFGEGDIVEAIVTRDGRIKARGVITFGEFDDSNDNVYTGFYIKWHGENYKWNKKSVKWWVINRSLKIVGNIYDNPELLKED